jgi:hypothetical protein
VLAITEHSHIRESPPPAKKRRKIPLSYIYSTTIYSSKTTAKKSSWGGYTVAVVLS